MDYFSEIGYAGLFLAAFLAATILPLSSEIVLTGLLLRGESPLALLTVATMGNVLGSLVNYALGYWASKEVIRKWLQMSEKEFVQAEKPFAKYGLLALLLAWVPIIGDPITVVAGILRVRLLWFVLLVAAGKGIRYVFVSALVLQVQ